MKSFRQLLRQPIKFIAGLILMTMAASIVCICVGQSLAATNTAKQLDKQFTTVALPHGTDGVWEGDVFRDFVSVSLKQMEWVDETAQSRPDVIKAVAEHGILSANVPELTPLNYTEGIVVPWDRFFGASGANVKYYVSRSQPFGVPYSCAMLVITLEEVSEPVELIMSGTVGTPRTINTFGSEALYMRWLNNLGDEKVTAGYMVSLAGSVTDVVSLQEGFRDPTGMTARLTVSVETLEELEDLDLQPGESYIVYGMDYYDEDWELRGYLADKRNDYPMQIDQFDLDKLHFFTEEELNRINQPDSGYVAMYDNSLMMTKWEVNQINTVSMTLALDVQRLSVDGTMRRPEPSLVSVLPDVTYTDRNGEIVTMSTEEYQQRYQTPTIAKLEGSVEDFLQSEDSTMWRQALERDAINNHAFAVLGVDSLEYLADFALEVSRVVQGRDFTDEELNSGARVCIINEKVAVSSGLEVGDTVTLNLYQGDLGLPYQWFRNHAYRSYGALTPSADFYFDTTPILETAEYTIVGFWRSPDTWVDVAQNEYGLSPNTVIVPNASVATEMEYSDTILFNTVVLQNGRMEEFVKLAAEAGFGGSFTCYDQGYSKIANNFDNYDALAQQVLIVGAAVYAVILLLFLLLFPCTQGKTVATMESLGTPIGKRLAHVMLSAAAISAPATVLGGGLGLLLWQRVLDALQASAETAVALQLESSVLLLLALAQFGFTMALTAIVAAWITVPRSLSARRRK